MKKTAWMSVAVLTAVFGLAMAGWDRGEEIPAQPVFLESGHSQNFEMIRGRQRNDVAGR